MKKELITQDDVNLYLKQQPMTIIESQILRKFVDFLNTTDTRPLICNCTRCEHLRKKYTPKEKRNANLKLF